MECFFHYPAKRCFTYTFNRCIYPKRLKVEEQKQKKRTRANNLYLSGNNECPLVLTEFLIRPVTFHSIMEGWVGGTCFTFTENERQVGHMVTHTHTHLCLLFDSENPATVVSVLVLQRKSFKRFCGFTYLPFGLAEMRWIQQSTTFNNCCNTQL